MRRQAGRSWVVPRKELRDIDYVDLWYYLLYFNELILS